MFDPENDTSFEWLTAGRLAKDRGKVPEGHPEDFRAALEEASETPRITP